MTTSTVQYAAACVCMHFATHLRKTRYTTEKHSARRMRQWLLRSLFGYFLWICSYYGHNCIFFSYRIVYVQISWKVIKAAPHICRNMNRRNVLIFRGLTELWSPLAGLTRLFVFDRNCINAIRRGDTAIAALIYYQLSTGCRVEILSNEHDLFSQCSVFTLKYTYVLPLHYIISWIQRDDWDLPPVV